MLYVYKREEKWLNKVARTRGFLEIVIKRKLSSELFVD